MRIIPFLLALLLSVNLNAQSFDTTSYKLTNLIYKETSEANLSMDIYYPKEATGEKLPAVVFFFGGGWVYGNRQHFAAQSKYFASQGIIAIAPDYRIMSKHGTHPRVAVSDARSAMRYIKLHADELGIDTTQLAAAGGSAGGHLALCTALPLTEESTETIDPSPDALILFNPVVNTTAGGYGAEKMAEDSLLLSPYHQLTAELPPTLIFHGTGDTTVPVQNVYDLVAKMEEIGLEPQLHTYEGHQHGFFNLNRNDGKYFYETLKETEKFLMSMGFLDKN